MKVVLFIIVGWQSIEAFPGFAAAVICAISAGVPLQQVAALAVAFVAFRTIYIPLYWINLAPLRSLAWICSWFCVLGLFASIFNAHLFDNTPQQLLAHAQATYPQWLAVAQKFVKSEL
jgi:hypothetical protein